MPTEQQIEKVARALFDYRFGDGSWDVANRPDTRKTLGVQQRMDDVRVDALVAIAAMPQPIGYAVAVTDPVIGFGVGSSSESLNEVTDDAADFRDECSEEVCTHVTVVALVPVEVQP